jgi:hypothetical protein
MLTPYIASESKRKPSKATRKMQAEMLFARFLLGLLIGPDDNGDMFIRNIG